MYSKRRGDFAMATQDPSLADVSFAPPIPPSERMTEDKYVAWAFAQEFESEWVNGKVIVMSPISQEHDRIFSWIMRVLADFVDAHDLGSVHGPEFQVRLATVPSRREPDLLFVSKARSGQLRKNHLEGPPDMIVEIVSPESVERDWDEKRPEYESAGVTECWVVDPMMQRVEVHRLSATGKYEVVPEGNGWLVSTAVPGFRLKSEWFWPATRPKVVEALRAIAAAT
jgi:Uma2 family endonuclease